jgi:hypothetical protein
LENWQIALVNETRRRQEEIAVADMHRLSNQIELPAPLWKRALNFILAKLGKLMVRTGSRLEGRVNDLASPPDAKISSTS